MKVVLRGLREERARLQREQVKKAKGEIEILSHRLDQIHKMGPNGRCPICMQTLGENYGETEGHLREEAEEKREALRRL